MSWTGNVSVNRSFSGFAILRVIAVLHGPGVGHSMSWQLIHGLDRNAAGTVIASDTATSTTEGDTTDVSFTVPSKHFIWIVAQQTAGTILAADFFVLGKEGGGDWMYHVARVEQPDLSNYQGLPLLFRVD